MFSSKFWLCTLVAAVLVVVLGECCKHYLFCNLCSRCDYSTDSAAALQSVCSLSKPNFTRVSCRGSDVKKQWFYKADEQRCKPFISCSATQVEGEVNSFNSLAECSARCIGEYCAAKRLHVMLQLTPRCNRRPKRVPKTFKCSAERDALSGTYTDTARSHFTLQ